MALTDQQKAEVEAALIGGQSVRGLAKAYGVSESAVRDIKKKAGLPSGTSGAAPSSFEEQVPTDAVTAGPPVPSLGSTAMGEVAWFAFWCASLALGEHWELSPAEQQKAGAALSGFVPNLPGWAIEKLLVGVVWLRPATVFSNIIRHRLDIEKQLAAGVPPAQAVQPPARHLQAVPPPAAPPPPVPVPPPQQAVQQGPPVTGPEPVEQAAVATGPSPETVAYAKQVQAANAGMDWPTALFEAAKELNLRRKLRRGTQASGVAGTVLDRG